MANPQDIIVEVYFALCGIALMMAFALARIHAHRSFTEMCYFVGCVCFMIGTSHLQRNQKETGILFVLMGNILWTIASLTHFVLYFKELFYYHSKSSDYTLLV